MFRFLQHLKVSIHILFRLFWKTHMLYPAFFGLLCIHGLGGILQAPRFYYVFGIPALIFTLDHLTTWRRSKVEVEVEGYKLLKSNVLELRMEKPQSFHYKSGMWFRIACKSLRFFELFQTFSSRFKLVIFELRPMAFIVPSI